MEQTVSATPLGPHEYSVAVVEGDSRRAHKVVITDGLLDDLALHEPDEVQLVEQSFAFLLEREPAAALPHDVDLEDVRRRYPDYHQEIRTRLGV